MHPALSRSISQNNLVSHPSSNTIPSLPLIHGAVHSSAVTPFSGTPYSDALKEVAMSPLPFIQHPPLATDSGAATDKYYLHRASLMTSAAATASSDSVKSPTLISPYWMQALSAHAYKTSRAAFYSNTPQYPMIYEPYNLQYFLK